MRPMFDFLSAHMLAEVNPDNYIFFFLMVRLPASSTLFPYTTLFRSGDRAGLEDRDVGVAVTDVLGGCTEHAGQEDRKSTRLNSSHVEISYAVFCLKKKIQSMIKVIDIKSPITEELSKYVVHIRDSMQ